VLSNHFVDKSLFVSRVSWSLDLSKACFSLRVNDKLLLDLVEIDDHNPSDMLMYREGQHLALISIVFYILLGV